MSLNGRLRRLTLETLVVYCRGDRDGPLAFYDKSSPKAWLSAEHPVNLHDYR